LQTPNEHWTNLAGGSYSGATEILNYFKGIADKYGLRKYIRLDHKVVGAFWNEHDQQWHVRIQRGDSPEDIFEDQGHILVNASGVLKWVSLFTMIWQD
jgi:cation diffusion facilitator CzcD-associated flavoprotein CzcO